METLISILAHIRFQRDGFLIGVFQNDMGQQIALGNMLNPEVGMQYKLTGAWTNDAKWGRQFRFERYEKCTPKDVEGIIRYLSQTAKWVQIKTAQLIVDKYGDKALDVLRNEPERVAKEIRGLSRERALEIQEVMKENEENEAAVVELEKLVGGRGLRKSLPSELVAIYGCDAPTIVKDNPYILMELKGIGFRSADTIALSIKYDRMSIHRQAAGVLHIMREKMAEGNTWMQEKELLLLAKELLGCSAKDGMNLVLEKKSIVREENYVALGGVAKDEAYISVKLKRLVAEGLDVATNRSNG